MPAPLLGCLTDDYTGASDLASNLADAGLNVIQYFGTPNSFDLVEGVDAVVVALRTRSAQPESAVIQSLAALKAMQSIGTKRFIFKYSSTFDSTEKGNIGCVAEALLNKIGAEQTVFCPANPEHGRTVYQGHLFVGNKLLGESGMESHPLNPMIDSNLKRLLSKQTTIDVGVVPVAVIQEGCARLQETLQILNASNCRFVIVDAISDEHIRTIALACANMPLVTGSSSLARALPDAYRAIGLLPLDRVHPGLSVAQGRTAILSGSCSKATQEQVAYMKSRCPTFWLDIRAGYDNPHTIVDEAVSWASHQLPELPILFYSTADSHEVAVVQAKLGRVGAANAAESLFGEIASRLAGQLGVRKFIVAGGETSGAIVSRLGIHALRIGPRIAPGVPWTESIDEPKFALALKSGNFGAKDFFQRALDLHI